MLYSQYNFFPYQPQQNKTSYHAMFSIDTLKGVLAMLSVNKPTDIRDIMSQNTYSLNIVAFLESLRSEGLVTIATGGWILTDRGQSLLEG